MAKNKKPQLEITADATGALNTIKSVGVAADEMGQKVVGAGQGAGKGLEAIGASGEKSAEKLSRAYGRMESEIRRVTAATQAAVEGTGRAGEFLNKAVAQGLDPGRIEPMLAKLREYESRQRGVGLSSREMAFALRGIPAQFTDIATSLASGQRPLTVLLQQGGQLKDMFGGIGPAASAMGGYVAGLVNPFTVAALAVGGLTTAWYQGSKEAQEYQKALILTGNAAGLTAGQLAGMAEKVAAASGSTQGLAAEALTGLAGSGKIAADNMTLVAEAATRMQRAAGIPIADTIKQFEELGREPVKASEKLDEQANYLTETIYRQIKALVEHGKTTEAAALAQTTWANAINNRAPEIVKSLGYIEQAWQTVAVGAKKAWDMMLDVGRQGDPVKELEDRIRFLNSASAGKGSLVRVDGKWVDEKKHLQEMLDIERAKAKAAADTAAQTAKQNEQNKAGRALAQERDKYLDREQQKKIELARLEELFNKTAKTDKHRDDYLKAVAGVNEKYAEKIKASTKAAKTAVDEFAAVMNRVNAKDSGVDASFWKDLNTLHAGYKAGRVDTDAYAEAVRNLTNQQGFAKDAAKAAAEAEESIWKAREKAREEAERGLTTLQGEIEQQQRHNEEIGLTAAGLADLADRRMQDAIATKEQEFAKRQAEGADLAELKLIDEQIGALEKLRQLKSDGAARQAVADSAKQAADEWKRFFDDIERALTDSLMRGFENGESFGKNFVKSLQNILKTTVLKIAVQAAVSPVMSGIGQALGVPNTGNTGGIGSLLNLGNQGASAYNNYMNPGIGAGMSSLYGSFATSSIGQSLGLSTATAAGYAAPVYEAGKLVSAGTGTAAGGMTSAGMSGAGMISSISTAMPYIAAAMVIADAAGMFKAKGGPQSGQYGTLTSKGYSSQFTMSGGDNLGNQALAETAYAQVSSLYQMAGKKVGDLVLEQGYKLDPQGSAAGVAFRNITVDGKELTGGTFDGNNGGQWYGAKDDAAGAAGYLGKLQGAEILAVVEAIGDAEFSATVAKLAANFEDLTVGLTQYTAAQATQKQLLAAMATDDERQTLMLAEAHKALDSTFAALGQTVPASAAGFRDLVGGLDLTTQAGQDTLAKLTGVSDAFLLVANSAKAAEQEQNNWRLKLDIMQGKYTEQQAERFFALHGAADDATRAIMQQVYALEDQQVAASAAADAAKIAADALAELSARAASVKSSAYGAYSGLLSATGNERGALEFNVSAAQEAYQQALAAVAGNAGISSAAAQGYIDANGGIAAAAAKYWGELGNGMDEATIRSKELLTDLVNAASGVAQAQNALKGFNDQAAISVDTVSQVADDQARAQQQIRDEWQRTADSIYDTIRKLRGEMLGDKLGYAKAQTDYTIALAQAKAGSQDAANRLPELANALVDLGKINTSTATEQALLTARTLAGLQDVVKNIGSTFGVTIPAFAVGTNRVPQDMLAMVHKDEAIIPAAFNPWAGGHGGNADMLAELRALRAEVAELRAANSAENRAIASATTKTAKTLERFDDADALTVRVTA